MSHLHFTATEEYKNRVSSSVFSFIEVIIAQYNRLLRNKTSREVSVLGSINYM